MSIYKKVNQKWVKLKLHNVKDESEFEDIIWKSNSLLMPIEELEEGKEIKILLRQLPAAGYSIDLLGIDESGGISIIDCKMITNREQKRTVVAQLLDYGSTLYGKSFEELEENIKNSESKFSKENCKHWNDFLARLDNEQIETFRKELFNSLRYGKFIYIITGEKINQNLKKFIRFLRTQNLNFYALEIDICKDENSSYAVSRFYGIETSEIIHTQETKAKAKLWDEESFLEELDEYDYDLEIRNVARDLLEFAKDENALDFTKRRLYASFDYTPETSKQSIFSVYSYGNVCVNYGKYCNILPKEKINYLGKKLNNELNLNLPFYSEKEGKYPHFEFNVLKSRNNMEKFKEFVKDFEKEVKKASNHA